MPNAERRQLTCLFCDIEGSVALSERLDPEEWRDVLSRYQAVCASVTKRFEGHVARYFGDGIMVYFGFPRAHEDEAQRAVRSGLGIAEGVSQLNTRLEPEYGIRLRVRIGIHTGLVVAGDIGPGDDLETMAAIGDTPNVAARLQALAAPDTVVVSAATYRLIAGYFNCRELGFRSLRGISQPLAIYQVLHESGARTRLEAVGAHGLPAMAGRDNELHALRARWRHAIDGEGGALLVLGEPGIGKSRLMWAIEEDVAQSPEPWIVQLFCSPFYANTAFHPVIDFLERGVLQFTPDEVPAQRLDKIEGFLAQYGFPLDQSVPLLAQLLSVPLDGRYQPLDVPADRQKRLIIETLAQIVLLRAEKQPMLFVVEDLHWADPSSLDFLSHLLDRATSGHLLILLTSRPEALPDWTPALTLQRLELERLDRDASVVIVSQIAERDLPPPVLNPLLDRAGGVPLYLEELTKLLVEIGAGEEENGEGEQAVHRAAGAIPATLADSLMARLDRLSTAKHLAQVGAVIGREFSQELMELVVRSRDSTDEPVLARDLDRLVDAGLLFVSSTTRGRVYTFKHALIQDVAYASLLRTSRQHYHERIAEILVEHFPTVAENAPELVAHHYTEAASVVQAVPFWLRAGQRAIRSSANPEAIAHLTTGLELLDSLPETPERAAQELEMQLTLGPAYMATRGYGAAEVERCYDRARDICHILGESPQLAPVLYGLWTYHIVRAHHRAAFELGQQIVEIATSTNDESLLIQGNLALGWSNFFLGRSASARIHFERLLQLYDDERHASHAFKFGDNPAASGSTCLAETLWLLGYPDQGADVWRNVMALLGELTHPYSVAFGLSVCCFFTVFLGDAARTLEVAEASIDLSQQQGLALIAAMSTVFRGWALARQGALDDGIAEMRAGIAAHVQTGAGLLIPFWNTMLAEVLAEIGNYDEALALLDAAMDAAERTDELYWEPEIHRLRGRINALAPSRSGAAEDSYRQALELARAREARSLELRVATDMAVLWLSQGRPADAREVLSATYGWFTEGFGTPDLVQAKHVLEEVWRS